MHTFLKSILLNLNKSYKKQSEVSSTLRLHDLKVKLEICESHLGTTVVSPQSYNQKQITKAQTFNNHT